MKPNDDLIAGVALFVLYLILGLLWLIGVVTADSGRTPCDIDTPEQSAYCEHVTGRPARAWEMWR